MLSSGKLPDTFARDVLKRVSLHPIKGGCCFWNNNTLNGTGVLHMDSYGSPHGLLFLAMPIEDCWRLTRKDSFVDQIMTALMDKLRKALNNTEVELSEFILHLDDRKLCHAEAVFGRGRRKETVDIRVSDAVFISFKQRIPILAHEDLVRAGKAGTDEWEFPSDYQIHDDRPIMSVVFNTLTLLDIPFKASFVPQDSEDAICYHADPSAHTLRVTAPRTGWSTVVSLDEHLSGLGHLHKSAEALEPHGTFSDDYGHYYHLRISANQDTITVCFIAREEKDIMTPTP
jgi:hypothetical protein